MNPKGEMKGSAITGPVAKECVRVPFLCSLRLELFPLGPLKRVLVSVIRHGEY